LLHGHSYTAHPVGCYVAGKSLAKMVEMERDGVWDGAKNDWKVDSETNLVSGSAVEAWSVWSKAFVSRISHSKEVESVIALGSVLAINLQDENAGKLRLLVDSEKTTNGGHMQVTARLQPLDCRRSCWKDQLSSRSMFEFLETCFI